MMADVPGGRLSPAFLSSSSLNPLSRTLPQMPPLAPATAAPAMMLGGKISPTTPPAMAPRFAHFFPLGSALSMKCTLPPLSWTTTAASIRWIEPSRSMARKSLYAASAWFSVSYIAMKTSTVVLVICLASRRDGMSAAVAERHPKRVKDRGRGLRRARGGSLVAFAAPFGEEPFELGPQLVGG